MGVKLYSDFYGELEKPFLHSENNPRPNKWGLANGCHLNGIGVGIPDAIYSGVPIRPAPCKIYTRKEIAQLEKELECNK